MLKKIFIKSNYAKYFILLLTLVIIISCQNRSNVPSTNVKKILRVGFDVDDTLLFSTPAFNKAKEEARWGTKEFWTLVNSYDEKVSIIKKKTKQIVEDYQKQGAEIFVITARPHYGGEKLKDFLNKVYQIHSKNVFFAEPKNQKMK